MKKGHDESITVHTTDKNCQGTTIDHIFNDPFIEFFNVTYIHSWKRASPLIIPLCTDMNLDRKNNVVCTCVTLERIKYILTQSDVTILQSRLLKEQRMLCLITTGILKHLSDNHVTVYHENDTASSKCQVFTVRVMNKLKSVNATVFMVPHDTFPASFLNNHSFQHVYSGPDEAMLNRNVIKIGKYRSISLGVQISLYFCSYNRTFCKKQGQYNNNLALKYSKMLAVDHKTMNMLCKQKEKSK